jgi:lysophospholipase L1-like esterase
MVAQNDPAVRGWRRVRRATVQVVFITLITVLLAEVAVRIAFAVKLRDANVLAYPLHGNVSTRYGRVFGKIVPHQQMDGYRKYWPDPKKDIYVLSDDGGFERDFTRINANGFRDREVPEEKPAGVIRVICLGESSTFGAFNRDHDTYPRNLERLLNDSTTGPRYEVFNFGVSEATTEELRHMIEAEVLPLQPDVVTFYGGHNDVRNFLVGNEGVPLPEQSETASPARQRNSLFLGLDLFRYVQNLSRPPDPTRGQAYETIGPRYRENVEFIADALSEHDIEFFFVTQKVKAAAPEFAGDDYSDYFAEVLRRYETGALGNVFSQPADFSHWNLKDMFQSYLSTYNQYVVLAHYRLMADLSRDDGSFEIIDGIAALDGHDDEFVTEVHLSPAGNYRLAKAISDRILVLEGPSTPDSMVAALSPQD